MVIFAALHGDWQSTERPPLQWVESRHFSSTAGRRNFGRGDDREIKTTTRADLYDSFLRKRTPIDRIVSCKVENVLFIV